MLEKGTACEFEVFSTPHWSCYFRDEMAALSRGKTGKTVSKKACVEFDMEAITMTHSDDICESRFFRGALVLSFCGGSKSIQLPTTR